MNFNTNSYYPLIKSITIIKDLKTPVDLFSLEKYIVKTHY